MRAGKKDDARAKKVGIGKIRRAQLITTFGPGSIAEMPEYTVILGATDYWSKYSPVFHEPNLQRLLGVKAFKMPYSRESQNPQGEPDVPAFRFPRMHFCPKCGKLDEYYNFGDVKKKRCIKCNVDLVPSRFMIACVNGHLEDFPFEWWVHNGYTMNCDEPDNHHKTKIEFMNNTGGLASIVISCEACGKKRSMEGCMNSGALKGYKCHGRRPWIGFSKESNDPNGCDAVMRAMQRGASNAYFGLKQSALTIPPWSGKLHSAIQDKWDDIETAYANKMEEPVLKQLLQVIFRDIIEDSNYSVDDILNEIKKLRGDESENSEPYSEHRMLEDEYRALCEGYQSEDDSQEQFHAEVTTVSESLLDYIEEVVLVKRLREVQALRGFRRITPTPPSEEESVYFGVANNEFTPLSNKPLSWLPAIEMRGEGIFIKLNSEALSDWEERIGKRYNDMKKRLGSLEIGKGMFSSRYILLHTLSHLLIRQLTIDCGYQEAALKERIYSSYPNGDIDMAGILIYTSASDSDGSLGGLVRQGEEDLLETTLRNALQEASWCSSDPLCIESEAQGYNSLNYSACHACTLLPETSCESRNCLLDRVSVIGKPDDRSLGFFGDFLGG